PDHPALDGQPGEDAEDDRRGECEPPRDAPVDDPLRQQDGGQGAELSVGEVDEAVRLVDEHEPHREEPDRKAVDRPEDERLAHEPITSRRITACIACTEPPPGLVATAIRRRRQFSLFRGFDPLGRRRRRIESSINPATQVSPAIASFGSSSQSVTRRSYDTGLQRTSNTAAAMVRSTALQPLV